MQNVFKSKSPLICLMAPAVALLLAAATNARAEELSIVISSVPTHLSGEEAKRVEGNPVTRLDAPPSYDSLGSSAGIRTSSNTINGGAQSVVLDLFSFRRASIGFDHAKDRYGEGGIGPSYPTHALELDASFALGRSDSDRTLVGGAVRARGMIAGTTVGRNADECGAYFGGSAQLDASEYRAQSGDSGLIASIGPEGGLMCQKGEVMLQLAPTATIGHVRSLESDAIDEVHTGLNMLGLGARARLLVGNRLYFSADATVNPKLTAGDWTSRTGSLDAQLRSGGWVFVGTLKHLEMKDPSGTYQDVKSNEATVGVGRAW